jgi:hypothetical protein
MMPIPIPSSFKLPRWAIPLLVAGALFATGGFGFWLGMAAIERMQEAAAASARAERNAHWRAEIAAANAAHEADRARQAEQALAAEAAAQAAQASILDQLKALEARNAALPQGGRCGVDRARVRLLQNDR